MCCTPCIPLVKVVSVSVNNTTNVATLTLDSAIPNAGRFDLCFCNCSGVCETPDCITACQYPNAKVQFVFGSTTYANVFSGKTGSSLKLSQVVKFYRKFRKMHFNSSVGTGGAIVCCDKLPCANVSFATTTSEAPDTVQEVQAAASAAKK